MSNLSDLLPSGGAGGKTADFTANGAISSGAPVILESGGDVAPIAQTTAGPDAPIGSITQITGDNTEYAHITPDPNNSNRWVLVYTDDIGNKNLRCTILTRSGTSVTKSSEIDIITGGSINRTCKVAFDKGQTDVFVVMYLNNSNNGVMQAFTISGSAGSESLSSGTAVQIHSGPFYGNARGTRDLLCFGNGKFIGIWNDASSNCHGVVCTLSGTTLTAGSEASLCTNLSGVMHCLAPHKTDDSKVFFAYRNSNSKLAVRVLGISGTSITVNSERQNSTSIDDSGIGISVISATKLIFNLTQNSNRYLAYQVATFDGTDDFTFGTFTTIQSNSCASFQAHNNPYNFNLKYPFSYVRNTGSGNRPQIRVITSNSDASSISVSSEDELWTSTVASSWNTQEQQSDSFGHFIYVLEQNSDLYYILGNCGGTTTNLTSNNFVGIASAAISDDATGTVTLQGGVSEAVSSLTTGSTYYVQADGTLGTTADDPSVEAGKALSATKLLIAGP